MPSVRTAFAFVALFGLATGYGCGVRESQVVGKWKGQIKLTPEQEKDPAVAMTKSLMNSIRFDLELKPDKKFTMRLVNVPIEGSWRLSGNLLSLKAERAMGMATKQYLETQKAQAKQRGLTVSADSNAIEKPMRLTVSADGQSLTLRPEAAEKAGQIEIVFAKD